MGVGHELHPQCPDQAEPLSCSNLICYPGKALLEMALDVDLENLEIRNRKNKLIFKRN